MEIFFGALQTFLIYFLPLALVVDLVQPTTQRKLTKIVFLCNGTIFIVIFIANLGVNPHTFISTTPALLWSFVSHGILALTAFPKKQPVNVDRNVDLFDFGNSPTVPTDKVQPVADVLPPKISTPKKELTGWCKTLNVYHLICAAFFVINAIAYAALYLTSVKEYGFIFAVVLIVISVFIAGLFSYLHSKAYRGLRDRAYKIGADATLNLALSYLILSLLVIVATILFQVIIPLVFFLVISTAINFLAYRYIDRTFIDIDAPSDVPLPVAPVIEAYNQMPTISKMETTTTQAAAEIDNLQYTQHLLRQTEQDLLLKKNIDIAALLTSGEMTGGQAEELVATIKELEQSVSLQKQTIAALTPPPAPVPPLKHSKMKNSILTVAVCSMLSAALGAAICYGVVYEVQIKPVAAEIENLELSKQALSDSFDQAQKNVNSLRSLYTIMSDRNAELIETNDFFVENIVFVINGRTYHKLGCSLWENQSYLAYNIANARAKGYRPCSYCN